MENVNSKNRKSKELLIEAVETWIAQLIEKLLPLIQNVNNQFYEHSNEMYFEGVLVPDFEDKNPMHLNTILMEVIKGFNSWSLETNQLIEFRIYAKNLKDNANNTAIEYTINIQFKSDEIHIHVDTYNPERKMYEDFIYYKKDYGESVHIHEIENYISIFEKNIKEHITTLKSIDL